MSHANSKRSFLAGIGGAGACGEQLSSFTPSSVSERSNSTVDVPVKQKPSRVPALDFTKGALVLIMVLYHWMNYFVAANGSVYKYLRFLTPSFIFITGFLISQVYFLKYETTGFRIPRRLIVRGFKLLGIVLSLNVAVSTLHLNGLETRVSDMSAGGIALALVTGLGSVAFSVLVPIAYLLMLSAVFLVLSRYYKGIYHLACAACVVCALVLELKGIRSGYLQIFSVGMLGIIVGRASIDRINRLVEHRLGMLGAYLAYLAAITLWGDTYLLQIVGVCTSLAVIYWMGTARSETSVMHKVVILLGQYSLFAYIVQIAILQLLRRSLSLRSSNVAVLGVTLLLGAALTILSVEIVDYVRSGSRVVNRLYAAVFS